MKILTETEQELLRHAVITHDSRLLPVLSEVGRRPLTRDEREELRGALSDEMVPAGIDYEHDEPTDYGRRLDDLIGRLGELSRDDAKNYEPPRESWRPYFMRG